VSASENDWDGREREALAAFREEFEALRERHRGDPPIEILRAARAGALPDALQGAAASHLEQNSWSRALVDGAEAADASLDDAATSRLRRHVQREARADGRPRRWLAVWRPALALAAVAVVAAVIIVRRAVRPEPPPVADAAHETAPAPVRSAKPFRLRLDKPDVKLTATALVRRGQVGGRRFVDEAAPALNAYRAGDYAAAAREFEALIPRYPTAVEVPFYLGVSRLFLGDVPGAIEALRSAQALGDATFSDDILWYLAVAHERAGWTAETRAELAELCRGASAYAARSCEAARAF
jgi:hypothetical protein